VSVKVCKLPPTVIKDYRLQLEKTLRRDVEKVSERQRIVFIEVFSGLYLNLEYKQEIKVSGWIAYNPPSFG
jgi:hypothetical protein